MTLYRIDKLQYEGLASFSMRAESGITVILSEDAEALGRLEACLSGRRASQSVKHDGRIGYMPLGAPVYTGMKVGEWMIYMGLLAGLSQEEAAAQTEALLEEYGLTEEKNRYLSAKTEKLTKARIVLAQTLLRDPDVLLLDHPFEGLTEEEKESLGQMILTVKERCPVIVVGADPEFAEEKAETIYLLQDGCVAKVSPAELRERCPKLYGDEEDTAIREEEDFSRILADYEGGKDREH